MIFLSLFFQVFRNFLNAHIIAHIIIVDIGVHVDQIDDAAESVFLANRQLDRHTVGMQTIMHHLYAAEEVSTHGIHLVDVNHAGNLVLVSLAPNGFRLRLNATLCG